MTGDDFGSLSPKGISNRSTDLYKEPLANRSKMLYRGVRRPHGTFDQPYRRHTPNALVRGDLAMPAGELDERGAVRRRERPRWEAHELGN
jgi:hypothetical protein